MSTFRYRRWDGTQQLPAFDADDVLDALGDDVLAEGDVRRALQRLMQRGMRGTRGGDVAGLRRILEQLRARRQAELEGSNLDSVLGDVDRRLDEIIATERAGIERRARDAEQRALDAPPGPEQEQARLAEQVMRRTARQRENRLDALPPNAAGRISGLRDYEFMDDTRATRSTQLTDELRQQMLETYFSGLKEGVERITPEDLDGVREMVRDLNALLEKHATGADVSGDFNAFMAKHGRVLPARHLRCRRAHRAPSPSGLADGVAAQQPQPADARRAAVDDGRAAPRRSAADRHGAPGRQPPGGAPRSALRRAVSLRGR